MTHENNSAINFNDKGLTEFLHRLSSASNNNIDVRNGNRLQTFLLTELKRRRSSHSTLLLNCRTHTHVHFLLMGEV